MPLESVQVPSELVAVGFESGASVKETVPVAVVVAALLALTAMMLPRRTRALTVTGIVVFFVGVLATRR